VCSAPYGENAGSSPKANKNAWIRKRQCAALIVISRTQVSLQLERGFMAKEEEKILVDGTIIEALPGTQFRVRLDNGHEIIAYLSGRMRRYYIRILLGDAVRVEMSPYDMNRGRIVYRQRREGSSNLEEA